MDVATDPGALAAKLGLEVAEDAHGLAPEPAGGAGKGSLIVTSRAGAPAGRRRRPRAGRRTGRGGRRFWRGT